MQEIVVSRSTLPAGESTGVPSSNMEKRETVIVQIRRFDKLEYPGLVPGLKGWATAEDVVVILAENTRVCLEGFHPEDWALGLVKGWMVLEVGGCLSSNRLLEAGIGKLDVTVDEVGGRFSQESENLLQGWRVSDRTGNSSPFLLQIWHAELKGCC